MFSWPRLSTAPHMLSAHAHNQLGYSLAYYVGKGRQQAQDNSDTQHCEMLMQHAGYVLYRALVVDELNLLTTN